MCGILEANCAGKSFDCAGNCAGLLTKQISISNVIARYYMYIKEIVHSFDNSLAKFISESLVVQIQSQSLIILANCI